MTRRRTTANRSPAGRNIELAKIHIAAADLKLIQLGDDSAYRNMLWSVARVRSAKDLDNAGREKVLAHLRSVGWVDSKPFVRGQGPKPQVQLIRKLWAALGSAGHLESPTEPALRAFVKKQSAAYHPQKIGYDAPELLPPKVAQRVIEHLKHWCKRTGVSL